MYANCTGSDIVFIKGGKRYVFKAHGRAWTRDDIMSNQDQGVLFIVPRDVMTIDELDRARIAPDQYYAIPVFDDNGLTVGLHFSDNYVLPNHEHASIGFGFLPGKPYWDNEADTGP